MQPDITSNVSDVLRFIRRGLLLAMLVAVTAGVVAYVSSSRLPQTFRSEAVISAARSNSSNDSIVRPLNDSAYRVAATSNNVIIDTLTQLKIENPTDQKTINDFIKKVRIGTEANENWNDPSSLIRIAVSNSDSATAALQANTLANNLIVWDQNRGRATLEQQGSSLREQKEILDDQIRALQIQEAPESEMRRSSSAVTSYKKRCTPPKLCP
jgi:hypothetical protein